MIPLTSCPTIIGDVRDFEPDCDKALFNIAQLVLSVACGILVFRGFGGNGLQLGEQLPLWAYVMLVTAFTSTLEAFY